MKPWRSDDSRHPAAFAAGGGTAVRLYRRMVMLLFCLCASLAAAPADWKGHAPLDPSDPIAFSGDRITYGGRTIMLGERSIFVDVRLSDVLVRAYPHAYNSLKEAVRHLKDGTGNDPMRVYFAPGVYWADDPDTPAVAVGRDGREPFGMVIRCENLHFIGLTRDARNVVLASQRGQTQGAVGNFTMLDFHGDGLQVSNLTMGNFCNVDLDFPLCPAMGRKKRAEAITQAHVAYVDGDRAVARNVRFISRLNMNPLNGARRILFDRCHLECTDDALTGNGVYRDCTLSLFGQKPFYTTHRCGAVFLHCRFTAEGGSRSMVFCKAPGQVTLVDCDYVSRGGVSVGWTNYPTAWLRCYQAGFRLDGKPYTVGADRPECTVEMGDSELIRAFRTVLGRDTVYNTYNLLSGDDGWNPDGQDTAAAATCMPTALLLNRRTAELFTGGSPLRLSAEALRHGGYAVTDPAAARYCDVRWRVQPGYEEYVELSDSAGHEITVVPRNNTDEMADFYIEAYTLAGLRAAVGVTVRPSVLPAPAFVRKPVVRLRGGVAEVDYALDLGGRADRSDIAWYSCAGRDGSGAVPVAVSRGGVPELTYPLTAADRGRYIMAVVTPRHGRSNGGEPVRAVSRRAVSARQAAESKVLDTDFRTFPTVNRQAPASGFWTVDGYKPADTAEFPWTFDADKDMWTYGRGFNGAVGEGLLQAQRGARLMYMPAGEGFGDMSLTLCVDPTKTAGQGFGSATGQYMDVCLKFDAGTLTGYGLRIIRTVKHAKAVDFLLVKYDRGRVTPLTEPVSSVCYRTGCTIKIGVKGRRMTAHVATATPLPADSPLPVSVDLAADIEPAAHGGIAIQHTGTCGESTTMLHRLRVEWAAAK
ncbi:MAG: hypothetical protein J6K19_00710 [Prevotella sp.]|nr:hypothetical protein [Prevotella sp.]